ncbi:MAG: ABC transporter permease, partial [Acidobacteriota bacterium]
MTVATMGVNMLSVLGTSPFLGRGFTPEEGVGGRSRVALLNEGLWRQRFGGREDAIGETFRLDGNEYTLVGVMPDEFSFPFGSVKVWRPMEVGYDLHERTSSFLQPVGRLKPGISRDQALQDLNRIFTNAEREANGEDTEYSVRVVPLRKALTFLFDVIRPLLHVATAAYVLVLLIVCANVASLMLVRAAERTQETALRRALGADRRRILQQFLTEGLLLALVGGALGAVAAHFAVKLLAKAIPQELFRVGEISVDLTALFFTLLAAVMTAVVFTLKPALQATKVGLSEALKRSSTGATGGRRSRKVHDLIVVAEIALAVTLLTGTSLLAQSFLYMKNLDPGFNPEQVLTFELQLPGTDYDGDEAVRSFYARLVEEAEGLPGVISATAIDPLPLNWEAFSQDFYVPGGGDGQKDSERDQATEHSVGSNFFATMDIELQEGRGFSLGDTADSQPVIVASVSSGDRRSCWPTA